MSKICNFASREKKEVHFKKNMYVHGFLRKRVFIGQKKNANYLDPSNSLQFPTELIQHEFMQIESIFFEESLYYLLISYWPFFNHSS